MARRKAPTLRERLTPCACCEHPISQRHHLAPFADWGENKQTIQLCSNCHELYHLVWDSYVLGKQRAQTILEYLVPEHASRRSERVREQIEWLIAIIQRLERLYRSGQL